MRWIVKFEADGYLADDIAAKAVVSQDSVGGKMILERVTVIEKDTIIDSAAIIEVTTRLRDQKSSDGNQEKGRNERQSKGSRERKKDYSVAGQKKAQ